MYLHLYIRKLDPVVMRTMLECCVSVCGLAWIGDGRLRVAGSWFIAKSRPVIFLDYRGPIFSRRHHRRRCVSVCPRFRTLFSRRRAPHLSTHAAPHAIGALLVHFPATIPRVTYRAVPKGLRQRCLHY